MFAKTVLAAAALATTLVAAPVTTASASPDIDFNISIQTPNGSLSFGTGGGPGYYPDSMNCWEARHYLKGEFKKVQKIECNGDVYTFKVKKFNFGPWKTVKINSDNGHYWFV